MDYRKLGRTGFKVSPLCLGAMMFGERGNRDHADCVRIIHRALDAGINFIDTANVYSDGKVRYTNPVVTAPIIGPRTMERLEDNLHALDVRIPPEHLRRIDALAPPGTDV